MSFQSTLEYYVIPNLTERINVLVEYQYNNIQQNFYSWLSITSDEDFALAYENEFKKHFLAFYTMGTEQNLYLYAKNLSIAVNSLPEYELQDIQIFIKKMIYLQFKNINQDDLFN
jgi:hypothetical protein